MVDPYFMLVLFAVIGLCIGSFLNVVIHRLPKMMERAWQSDVASAIHELAEQAMPQHKEVLGKAHAITTQLVSDAPCINLAKPASRCPHCGHLIGALENIPVISYLIQGGKCKGCKAPISIRYPLIEMASSFFAALAWYKFQSMGMVAVISIFAFCAILLTLTYIDLDTMLLPDSLTLPLLWGGLLLSSYHGLVSLQDAVIGAVAGYLILWSVFWLFKLITGKEGMGYGDFKLLAALGAWLGWQLLPQVILIASLSGAIIGIASILFGKRSREQAIPFGPYLSIGGIISLFLGNLVL